jgi:hypothetical protein
MAFGATSFTVFVPKPSTLSFGDAMSGMRAWLDHQKIQPRSFKLAADFTRIGFEISFQNETHAEAFGEFRWPLG